MASVQGEGYNRPAANIVSYLKVVHYTTTKIFNILPKCTADWMVDKHQFVQWLRNLLIEQSFNYIDEIFIAVWLQCSGCVMNHASHSVHIVEVDWWMYHILCLLFNECVLYITMTWLLWIMMYDRFHIQSLWANWCYQEM